MADLPQRFGLATPEEIAGLSGLEMLQAIIEGRLPAPTMARTLGFRLVEVERGRALFEGRPTGGLLNPLGGVHGGWALALIDSAAGCALHTELHAGTGYATLETKVNFTRAISPDTGLVRCEGRLLTHGRQVGTAEAKLVDEQHRILAHGTSTLIVLHPRS